MKIRTQLALASFLLSIVPLAAIVLYSYHSSRQALESAYRNEAQRQTKQMDRRLAGIRDDLEKRLAEVSALPLQTLPGGTHPAVGDDLLYALGDTAKLLDSLEVQPMIEAAIPQPPAPPPPPEPIIIGIPAHPAVPRFRMSEEQRDRLHEIGRLGSAMGNPSITQEERASLQKQLDEVQKKFNDEMQTTQQKFQADLGVALKARGAAAAAADRIDRQVIVRRRLTQDERAKVRDTEKKVAMLFGQRLDFPIRKGGAVVGSLSAQVKPEAVIGRVLGNSLEEGELAFAADRDGHLYTRTAADKQALDRLGVTGAIAAGKPLPHVENWILSMSTDPKSGLRIGVARHVGDDLGELRRTAAFNFSAGIALILLALFGIVPVANHLTRDVKMVTTGAERIAAGDLTTRLPVTSRNEFGQLAAAFNKMAHDLSNHQQTIVEQELQQRVLEIEYQRKTAELEENRRFQLSMLPKVVPRVEGLDVAVFTETATEVGGDYYDFHVADGVLSVAVGDATGHGAKAGTMMTVVKTLFASYEPDLSPRAFLLDSADKIRRMDLGRMAMSLLLARFERSRVTIAAAGMPPVLVHRAASGTVEEIAFAATPLGTLRGDYEEQSVDLAAGDTLLFFTDGLPELLDAAERQFGYVAARDAFASAAMSASADEVIASLSATARRWGGGQAPNDDITFVVVRRRAASQAARTA